ncbi:MAG: hypothetical protein P1V97_21445 [Planctomycetota bacterium]|nr:hypothetical protein [Planctomycetota bacterium]
MEVIIRNSEDIVSEELQLQVMSLLVEALGSSDAHLRVGAMNLLSKLADEDAEIAPFVFDALQTK